VLFNVRINSNGLHSRLGLTEDELKERVVNPWREGRTFALGGRTFDPAKITELRITCGSETPEQLRRNVEWERTHSARTTRYLTPIDFDAAKQGADVTDTYIVGPPGHELSQKEPRPYGAHEAPGVALDRSVVWVVHGRNTKARDALYDFLRAIGLDPLEFSQATRRTEKSAPYVGEILDRAFAEAQAVVVLLTPDDEARLREEYWAANEEGFEKELTPQARPNVLFEAGWAFGSHPDRTVLVQLGDLRKFTNIAGRHIVFLDNSAEKRKELASRLEAAKCPVNLSGDHWLRAGDFTIADRQTTSRGSARSQSPQSVKTRAAQSNELPPDSPDQMLIDYQIARQDKRTHEARLKEFLGFVPYGKPGDAAKLLLWTQLEQHLLGHPIWSLEARLRDAIRRSDDAASATAREELGFEIAKLNQLPDFPGRCDSCPLLPAKQQQMSRFASHRAVNRRGKQSR
jgi:predicted nucleotide-binding protein